MRNRNRFFATGVPGWGAGMGRGAGLGLGRGFGGGLGLGLGRGLGLGLGRGPCGQILAGLLQSGAVPATTVAAATEAQQLEFLRGMARQLEDQLAALKADIERLEGAE